MEFALIALVLILVYLMPSAFKYLIGAPVMGIMFGMMCYGLMLVFGVADLTLHSLRHYLIFGIVLCEFVALLT